VEFQNPKTFAGIRAERYFLRVGQRAPAQKKVHHLRWMQFHREGKGQRPGLVIPPVIPVLFRVVKTNFRSVGYQVKERVSQGAQTLHPEKTGSASKEDLLAVEGFSRGRDADLSQAL
jgi:hypothetical protein